MAIFHENGHITAEGFFLLVTEKADEMQRLELSEHLSFCDRCLEQYLIEMEKITLLETEESIAKRVIKKVKHKTAFLVQKRFGTAVAAACIAMILWTSGAFSWTTMAQQYDTVERFEEELERFSWQNQNALHHISQKYQQILDKLDRREKIPYGEK